MFSKAYGFDTAWNVEEEEWYFSVVDVIEMLTESDRPRKYWNDLKKKLAQVGSNRLDEIADPERAIMHGDGE